MKTKFLLPAYFKFIGIVLLVPGLILGCFYAFFGYVMPFLNLKNGHSLFYKAGGNLTDEVATTLIIVGCFFIGFSRLKNEERITQKLRLNALYWAMVVNFVTIIAIACYLVLTSVLVKHVWKWTHIPADYVNYSIFFTLFLFLARFYYLISTFREHRLKRRFYLLPHFPLNTLAKTFLILLLIMIGLSFDPSSSINSSDKWFGFTCIIVGPPCLLLCIWTKEENEVSNQARLRAALIAYLINYLLFLAATWLVYGPNYLYVILISWVSLPLIFTLVFYIERKRSFKGDAAVEPEISPV